MKKYRETADKDHVRGGKSKKVTPFLDAAAVGDHSQIVSPENDPGPTPLKKDRNLTQVCLAALLQIHQTTYSDYERGKLNIPLSALDRLAVFCGVSVDYLLGRTEVKTPYPSKKR